VKRLAIIIPAYKATFLSAALDSIAMQTCKDFTLYVGDDCSPEPIGNIVEQYRDKIELVYQRFNTNLGGKDLVAQWERCIAMSQDEPYIWLFSDDDVIESNCVEELFRQIENTKGVYNLYHFNVDVIDERGAFKNYYGYGRYGKYGRYGYSKYGYSRYGYGNYGSYGNYANSHYGNKDDNSIKK
jgi:glycosyltransferase involved in cell wall biosynthesis